jgi:acetyl-CoA synthetase
MYNSKYKKGWYITGDQAQMDEDGYFWFQGRSDDVINTAGHLVGPFEVESALIEHPDVVEAGVIGVPDDIAMEVVKAFVATRPNVEQTDALRRDIMRFVRTKLSAAVAPRQMEFIDSLPKTRSGKIMRRLLKARELGLPEGDTSTLEDD